MSINYENASDDFFLLSSEQRLSIVFKLLSKKSKISVMAKELGATVQEVHRNFERLAKSDLIVKDSDGNYSLTTYGKTICSQVPSFVFVSLNKKYFKTHDFGDIPDKFVHRIGELLVGQHVKGFTKVLGTWNDICKNAEQYIYGILFEEPLELIEPIVKKAEKGVQINSIFSESTIVPTGRKHMIDKLGVKKLVENGSIERKMKNGITTGVILNEKEACLMFSTISGEADIGEMFYSSDTHFHEWCLDYFRYCWYGSSTFQESKLKE
ncbi:MAG: helix-turn-helix transcriptional regulator [Nitrosotalea sp.]